MNFKSRPWWDYSDDEDSDECSIYQQSTTASKSSQILSPPYHLKFVNFPYSVTEHEILEFLGLQGPTSNLKLLHTKGKKNKFRGIAVFRVQDLETGRKLMTKHGQILKNRQILVDIESEWEEEKPKYQQRLKFFKSSRNSTTKSRRFCRKIRK